MAQWKMRVGLNQLQHPFLIVLKVHIVVVNVLVNVSLQLVDKLLLIKTVKLFWHECLVVTECSDHAPNKSKALEKTSYLVDSSTDEPAFGDQFFNLLGIHHDGKTCTAEVVANSLPRNSLTRLNHNGKHNNLHVCESQLISEEVQGILTLLPELIRESGILRKLEDSVHGSDDCPSVWLLKIILLRLEKVFMAYGPGFRVG